jgi:hypothetical protein
VPALVSLPDQTAGEDTRICFVAGTADGSSSLLNHSSLTSRQRGGPISALLFLGDEEGTQLFGVAARTLERDVEDLLLGTLNCFSHLLHVVKRASDGVL